MKKLPAAFHVANGFGKFVGSTQVQELGVLETPIALTNTLSAFITADALVQWTLQQPGCEQVRSVNPLVGECNDGELNHIRLRAVTAEDVFAAIANAKTGPVAEGCVGAGTGVTCMGWKSGIGTSSRRLPAWGGGGSNSTREADESNGYTVGVLVQTNYGGSLTIAGVPVGEKIKPAAAGDRPKPQQPIREHGSVIVIVATDAPLDARRLERLARRAPLGLAATGTPISHGSGDYVLAFSTATELRSDYNSDVAMETGRVLRDDRLTPLFQAVRDATEEAVINSLLQATDTTGYRDRHVPALDPAAVRALLAD